MSNPPPSYPPPEGYQGGGYPPPPPNSGKTQTMGMAYNTAALLCYIPTCCFCIGLIFSLIFYFTEPKSSKFMRFHAFQGMMLAIAWIAVGIVFQILRVIFAVGSIAGEGMTGGGAGGSAVGAGLGIVGILLGLVGLVIGIGFLTLSIMGMVKANKGEMWKMPIIGEMADKNSN